MIKFPIQIQISVNLNNPSFIVINEFIVIKETLLLQPLLCDNYNLCKSIYFGRVRFNNSAVVMVVESKLVIGNKDADLCCET